MKKAFNKVQMAFDELAVLFQPEYRPAKKERTPRAKGSKKPGWPKKKAQA